MCDASHRIPEWRNVNKYEREWEREEKQENPEQAKWDRAPFFSFSCYGFCLIFSPADTLCVCFTLFLCVRVCDGCFHIQVRPKNSIERSKEGGWFKGVRECVLLFIVFFFVVCVFAGLPACLLVCLASLLFSCLVSSSCVLCVFSSFLSWFDLTCSLKMP